ncbi:deoxyguanosinetriphosphate triphosphohydrolase [Deinococcus sonorensis]|uniref:Deoxyguanosinetriphosphate triphosphohydrolase-like protein n=1 Tax=Deinococcus sonorensis TaxID=309891 RepID=A0ABV8YDQ9_9DEIO
MYDREALDAREAATLAPYATLSGHSRGRVYPEPESQRRTTFQKDRDRILHTTAFRRLEYKTQVFLNSTGDHYRTRLTHTLEVAQVARSVALSLGLNETLSESIALAHDLGHPPFGHAGERILNGLMERHGGFDHNRQTLRIVTELEDRYPDFPGLNLSLETLEGIAKHEPLASQTGMPSLEAQLVNIADGLAYSAHDLDDGLRSGLITPADLRGLPLWEHLLARLNLSPEHLSEKDRRVLQRELLGWLITDLSEASHARLVQHRIESPQQVQQHPELLMGFSETMRPLLSELNRFLRAQLYHHWQVERQVAQAEHALGGLFRAYLRRPAMLPPAARARTAQEGLERVVCDYLAGMTDRYAADEYRRLHGGAGPEA